jgi:hypothetical protein
MKVFKWLGIACVCISLASCIDVNENVDIKENGSGKISTTTDLSQLIDMMQAFGGGDLEKRKNEKIDTVIEMKSIVDTAKNLTADQKALLRNGKVRMRMNLAEKIFNVNMEFPFENLEKYQQLNNLLSSGAGGLGSVMKSLMGDEGMNGNDNAKDTTQIIDQPAQLPSPDMGQITSVFDFNASNGLIKKTLNREKYTKLMNDPQIQQLKQASDMGMEMLYTTTYKLPRPVKKVDNPAAKISDDKKTVIIRQNFLDIFTTPEKFEYTIQY